MAASKNKSLSDHGSLDADIPDSFNAEAAPSVTGVPVTTAAADTTATPATGALTINGTAGDDTLVVTATGSDSGTYSLNGGPAISFSHIMSFTFNGGSGNDNMIVHNPDGGLFAPVDGVAVHGGTQNGGAGDGLAIDGGATDTAIYTTDAHHADGKDGSIVLSHGALTATYSYTGLEPLANTGTATNIVFNLPAGADNAILEDDGIAGNNMSQLRSGNGTFETTVFTNPTGSLTINSGAGDTVTVNLVDALHGDLTIGSQTNAAVDPDSIAINKVATGGRVTLAATGAISESGADATADVTAGQLELRAGTGIGVGNTIETAVDTLEAQTNTGGIFISNTAPVLFIGGQDGLSTLTGLKVATSGDIDIVNAGSINLADFDGAQTVLGGSLSGNVSLTANGSSNDVLSGTVFNAIRAPGGGVTIRAGRDIDFFTPGFNSDFDNDVRADESILLIAGRHVSIDGDADIVADDFGHHTGAGVALLATGNVTISSDESTGVNGGASVGTGGSGDVTIRTGFGGANVLTNQGSVFSTAGNIIIQSNSQDFQPGSSIAASQGTVKLITTTAPVNADLGSTAAGFNFSQAELNTIAAHELDINPTGNITISHSITLDPLKVSTLALTASNGGAGNAGAIIDGTAGEQADLTVSNLLLQAIGSIGAADDIDVRVHNLAFNNANLFNVANPAVNISNTGALTITAVAGATASRNAGTDTTVTATGPLTVAADVTSTGQLSLETINSASAGQNLTVLPGVTVQSDGTVFLLAGDNIDLQAGSTVSAAGIALIGDALDADPGTGATFNVNGALLSFSTSVGNTSSDDADTVNITPSATSQIFTGGFAPFTGRGDTITVNTAGTTNPTLVFNVVSGTSKYGEFDFADRKLVSFTDFETLNVVNGPLTVNGSSLNDTFVVNSTGPGSGSFTVTGPYLTVSTTSDDSVTTISAFGVPNTATYGQVISADAAHSKLSTFSFEMNLPSTVAFRGEVYAWDGTKATGPALFESSVMSTAGAGMQDVTFNAGGIALTPGQQYVLFASTSEDQAGHSGTGSWGATSVDVYRGGDFVFLPNGNNPSQWTSQVWSHGIAVGRPDLAFRASFDEPATVNFSGLTSLGFSGLDGDDTYFVDRAGQVVTENPNQGNDIVHASINYTLPTNVESLILDGTAINGAGNAADNAIIGNAADNIIDGKGGSDFMQGGAGNDIYFVNNAGDAIVENPNAGNDIVHAAIDYTIGANIESLILDGTAINGAGNGTDNAIIGNAGNNIIDGKGGADFMVGGTGNDIYFVDNAGDAIVENTNEGNDIVHAAIDYTIGANIESLILDGTTINGAGNSTDNAIIGNASDNIIDGRAGADFMVGGKGNDIYFVDNAGDAIMENANEGNDIVHATISYAIGVNVDSLILDGSANLAGAGNSASNALVGNSGANNLDGRGGQDFLAGNGGNDTFEFRAGEAAGDVVADFAGNGGALGDSFLFIAFGTAAQGATFTEVGATNQWQIHSGLDAHNEVVTLQNNALVDPSDYLFA